MVINKTERNDSKIQWEISYLTKNWKKPVNLEMRLAGYKIKGSKIDIIVERNDENFFLKVLNWIVWLLTRSEVIFVVIITLLANVNKFLEELNSLIVKIKNYCKKNKDSKKE